MLKDQNMVFTNGNYFSVLKSRLNEEEMELAERYNKLRITLKYRWRNGNIYGDKIIEGKYEKTKKEENKSEETESDEWRRCDLKGNVWIKQIPEEIFRNRQY